MTENKVEILRLHSSQAKQWTAQIDMIHEESFEYDSNETGTLSASIGAYSKKKTIHYLLGIKSDRLLTMLTYRIFPGYRIEVTNLCTSRTERRHGYAKLLLEELQRLYPRCCLIGTVKPEREAAIRLYKKLGANITDNPNDPIERLVEGPKYQRTWIDQLYRLKSFLYKAVKRRLMSR